jgi:hypothetical protein
MKQKLIMENWRKFLESTTLKEIDERYESRLEEGIGSTLLTLVTFVVGGQTIQLDKAEQTLAYGMMDKIEQQGDTYSGVPVEDIRDAFEDYMAAAQRADYDGDGVSDKDIKVLEKTKGNAPDIIVGQLFQYVDGKGPAEQPEQDTGDTGSSSQETLNVSVSINQMDLAHTRGDTKARNEWAQSILDYNDENGGVPSSVISRAEFFVGK